ncbi:MAG: sugar phosphate nucleotidyltransferase [Rhizorhabdus sp.]
MNPIIPVILCGGSGTRLWPRSRATRPKPFVPLIGEQTLFTATIGRCSALSGFAAPVVVTGQAHLSHVEDQLASEGEATIIVEPSAKNTAAAIALAASRLRPDDVMLVCPSDHHIANGEAFVAAARAAAALASEGWLVSFGIKATSPETGFGYLKRGAAVGNLGYRVEQFVEKPSLGRATAFLAQGADYFWNGGIFAFRVSDLLSELAAHRPVLADAVRRSVALGSSNGSRFHPDPEVFATIEGESIDYAVMENTAKAAMVPADMEWSDIGNWQALHAARPRDEEGNSVTGRVELVACRNVLVDSDGPRVSVIGVSDVIVVVDGNEVLVTTATGAQKVGKLAGAMNQ